MSGLLKKEIRLLLPSWGAALLLVSGLWLVRSSSSADDGVEFLLFCVSPILMVMLALNSFGRELSAGTFANLLAQPVSRRRLWWTKALVLAVALGSVFALWWMTLLANPGMRQDPGEVHKALGQYALLPLVIYSGALWTVLLLRQVAAAFWLTVLIPTMLAMFTMVLTQKLGVDAQMDSWIIIVLVIYIIVGFWAGMQMFIRAQDVQWTGGEITLPGWIKWPRTSVAPRLLPGRRPRVTLLLKELQLHQSQLVIAGVLAVLNLAVVLLRPARSSLNGAPVHELTAYYLWVLWPVMALLIGCAAVAEERRLGTLEAQLCLPVRRRTQFLIKVGVALALSILFGVIAPVVVEGKRIVPEFETAFDAEQLIRRGGLTWGGFYQLAVFVVAAFVPLAPFVPFVIVATVLLGMSFYASTLSRNTLQAIAPAVLGFLALWAGVFGLEILAGRPNPPWRGPLIYLIGLPTLIATLAGLSYWNFKRGLVGWPVWRRNMLTLLVMVVVVATVTAGLYHRAWEHFTRLEPMPGLARFSRGQSPALFRFSGGHLTARLPDGNVWQGILTFDASPELGGRLVLLNPQSLGGTNWLALAGPIVRTETAAIHADGSLWLIETPASAITWSNDRPILPPLTLARHTRIGMGNDWRQVIRQGWSPACLLLKRDGSLWQWGTNNFDFSKRAVQKWPGLAVFEPRRLGTNSDWAEILRVNTSIYLWKTNGQAWAHQPVFRGPKQPALELDAGLALERYPEFDQIRWRSLNTGQPYQFGVREDGTLWAFNLMVRAFANPNVSSGQIGDDAHWLATACAQETAVALRDDGTLWKWHFGWRPNPDHRVTIPVRISARNDWIAISGDWDGVVALAADGSLWYWSFAAWPHRIGKLDVPPLLAVSRRPQRVGSVFDSAP